MTTPDPTHKEAANYVDSRTPEERERDSKIETTITTAGGKLISITDLQTDSTHKGVEERVNIRKEFDLEDIVSRSEIIKLIESMEYINIPEFEIVNDFKERLISKINSL